ncbi:MAG TPA: histidine kinase N-terminal 7TM domain-containing protein [Vicinamibacteria bacterium]|nr:histidine kinase N-terminal 7TM domain-containing protein [Vicinamibacteria bacterium]
MTWHFTPFAAPLFVGAALMLGIVLLALRRRPARGGVSLILLSLAVTVYVLAYSAELGSTTLAGVQLWLKVEYLGVANIPGLVLVVALAYTGRERMLTPLRLGPLFVVPAITCLLAWTNPDHELIWRGISIDRTGGFTWTRFQSGPWYWAHNAYIYLLVVAAWALLFQARSHASGLIRRQMNVLLVGTTIPAVVHLFYLAGLFIPGVDPNPYALVLAAAIFAWGMLDSRLWDIIPVAQATVLESLREAVLVVDARGRLADLNPAAQALLSLTPALGIGRPVAEVFPAWNHIVSHHALGETVREELVLALDGQQRHFEASVAPLRERPGRVEGRLLLLREITDRKQADQRLRLQAVALEAAANGILITDREGKIQWVNPAFTRMTGYPADEVLGSTTGLLKSGAHDVVFYRDLWNTILAGQVWRGEVTNRRKDGSLYTEEQTIAPVSSPTGEITHFIAVKQDVTERKQVESLRETLIHTMIHDLRSPLTVVSGALDLLAPEDGTADPESPLELARRSTQRVLDLLTAILEVHGLESGKMPVERGPLDLASLIGEALGLVRPLADAKHQRLTSTMADALPPVQADRGLLLRVIQNLAGNAIKFTPPGGSIRVSAAGDRAVKGMVTVSIEDDGPGIAPDLLPRLFREFVTGSLKGRGSGLGLAFCRLAVEAHGGRIRAESVPGQGATFTFTLPVEPPPAQG